MGGGSSTPYPVTVRGPINNGKIRICVAAYAISHRASAAHALASEVAKADSNTYETWYYFPEPREYHRFLLKTFDDVPFPDHLKGHSTSPFIWIETGHDQKIEPLGGLDRFKTWVQARFPLDSNPPPPKGLQEVMDSKEPSFTWALTWHSTLPGATAE